MKTWLTIALIILGCTISAVHARTTVQSSKTALRVSFQLPRGWTLDGPRSWPSYEEWYVGDQTCGLTVRIDKIVARPPAAQHSECEKSDDSGDETVGYVRINGQRVWVHAWYNVNDTTGALASLPLGRSELNIELFRNTRDELRRCFPALLSFLRSIRIEEPKA